MAPKYERRKLVSRYMDCGRPNETVTERSWNSSTLVEYSLPEDSTRKLFDTIKEEKANRNNPPYAMHFSDWIRGFVGTDSARGAVSPVSAGSTVEMTSWPGTLASSSKPKSRKHRKISKSQSPKDWNTCTTPKWRNTAKREQFRNILDGRRLPLLHDEKYKNVKPQYLKPRKRYNIVPPISKKKKRIRMPNLPEKPPEKTLVFRLKTQCSWDQAGPQRLCPFVCPVEGFFLQDCFTCCISTFDDQSYCCFPSKSSNDNPRPFSTDQSNAHDKDDLVSIKSQDRSISPQSDHSSAESEASTIKAGLNADRSTVDGGKSDTASSSAESSSDVAFTRPSSGIGRHVSRESDSQAETSPAEKKTDQECFSRVGASIGLLCPPPRRQEHTAKELSKTFPSNQSLCLWNYGGVCRMRFPFRACLGENGEDHDF